MNQLKLLSILVFLFLLNSCGHKYPRVLILTEIGTIEVELYTDKAPITANNFIRYVKEERFKGATFYRTVHLRNQPDSKIKIQVIQGGVYEDDHPQMLPPIKHEPTNITGILHKDGVISMARYEPGTATSEFFICVGDQPSLDYDGQRNEDGFGFAAFGKVVDGMDVVEQIHTSTAEGQYLDPRIRILDMIYKPD
ncbi:MAG: peptidylprolyl isomerase [Bacteroidales bacterium]|nr:peptidylprolyl isomerase [Bacteroidales bacterium]MCF8403266.1 peptidylprolyl isomerase [Bacteroidales bacterium]